jgi:hypothetical protein
MPEPIARMGAGKTLMGLSIAPPFTDFMGPQMSSAMDAASDGMVSSKADHTLERALANGSALIRRLRIFLCSISMTYTC